MMAQRGIILKFFGPWQMTAGVEDFFLALDEGITVSCLLRKLEAVFGEGFSSRVEGLICSFDDGERPRALNMEDKVFPGSTVLFLGMIESG